MPESIPECEDRSAVHSPDEPGSLSEFRAKSLPPSLLRLDEARAQRKRPFQFSLRTIFLVTTVLAVFAALTRLGNFVLLTVLVLFLVAMFFVGLMSIVVGAVISADGWTERADRYLYTGMMLLTASIAVLVFLQLVGSRI